MSGVAARHRWGAAGARGAGTPLAIRPAMDALPLFLCADGCPGLIEGVWAGLVTVAIGALVTLFLAMNAADGASRAKAVAILLIGGGSTLFAARFVGVAIWRMLDPGIG